ncbi:MAG: MarR family winged helix-turn-helix transcriptional regulator [Rhodospirillales bacterium]
MTAPPPPALDLETFLPYRLSVLANRVSRALAEVYEARFGITPSEWRLIAILARFGPMSANGVCDRSAMDKVQVSRAVARAGAAGLVDRRIDHEDRRRSVLSLTGQGRAVHDRIVPLAREVEARLLDGLDAGERALLSALIDRLGRRAADLGGGDGGDPD